MVKVVTNKNYISQNAQSIARHLALMMKTDLLCVDEEHSVSVKQYILHYFVICAL